MTRERTTEIARRDQAIDRVLSVLGMHPLHIRLAASADCDQHAAGRALALIELAGNLVDFTSRGDNRG